MKGGQAVMEKWLDDLYDLCKTVSHEIGEANKKIEAAGGKLTGADIDYIDKLTHTMKSIKTTIAMAEAEERDGESGYYPYMGGNYPSFENDRGMRGGRSNARRRDSMGRYSRESRRGYSRDEARMDFIEDVRDLMRDAPDEHTRMKFQRFIDEIENA
jgi:hypothetical protein